MKNFNISKSDIKYYFKQNRLFYFTFFIFITLGIAIGLVLILSSDSYLKLATSDNKILFPVINGTYTISEVFWNKLFLFLCPMVLVFFLNLNYIVGFLSYVYAGYQSALFVMSMASVVSLFGFSGILNIIFIIFPINLAYMLIFTYFSVACRERCVYANKIKTFAYGLNDKCFYLKLALSIVAVIVLVVFAIVVYPLFLKNSTFLIF